METAVLDPGIFISMSITQQVDTLDIHVKNIR